MAIVMMMMLAMVILIVMIMIKTEVLKVDPKRVMQSMNVWAPPGTPLQEFFKRNEEELGLAFSLRMLHLGLALSGMNSALQRLLHQRYTYFDSD